ncbi:MAG: exopolysaccharide Pel transporter PelG [Spirochaetaceae bacterium]|nr:exopolysaccharide Pel transporter PelG [Spirochaetaceae bacterium]
MAGIGFELQRVLKQGGMTGAFKVALAGIVIVAGPWLISILGIFALSRFAGFALEKGGALFTAAIVYSYAFSLFLFGGLHYIYTRYTSDLIYIKDESRAFATLILSMIIIGILSTLVAVPGVYFIQTDQVANLSMYRVFAAFLFVSINLIWLVMIFITLLKKYMLIFLVYILGMAISFGAVYYLGQDYKLGGAMAGFSIGQVSILIMLIILIYRYIKPGNIFREIKPLAKYFIKYKYLLGAGILYSAGIWIDKIALWFFTGNHVEGTYLVLFQEYDMTVYFANLTLIPGLVYFMVFSETNFYVKLRRFLMKLSIRTFTEIQEDKYKLIKTMHRSIREQSLFQGVITFGLIILSSNINTKLLGGQSSVLTIRLVLAGVFFHLLFLTLFTFLFYLEKYKEAFFTQVCFFSVNLGGTLYFASISTPVYGAGYLAAGILTSIISWLFLSRGIETMDRRIFGLLERN